MDALLDLLSTTSRGVLVSLKRDGRPQLSNISFGWDPATRTARVSVIEGDAELTGPAQAPDDAAVDGLVDLHRSLAGEHPDWDEYREAMREQGKSLLRITITGWGPVATGGFPPDRAPA